ncbi:MAG: glycosyltransferase family 2 protein [Candidatus Woesearchaeota archaeon]
MGRKIFIIIPAFNEEKIIRKVLTDLKSHGYKNLIVINDGSTDRTAEIAKEAGAIVLEHVVNRGQGAALRTGIDFALAHGADIIVTFDADGQHDPSDIPSLIAPIASGKADISLGSRFLGKKSNVSFAKKLVLKAGAVFLMAMYGVRLTDSHNGLRAMSARAAKALELCSDKMEHASEIIEKIATKKLRYVEVPVTIKYTSYALADGQSPLAAIKIAFRMLVNKLLR